MTKVRSIVEELWSPMEEVLREGARKLCQSVLEEEAQNYVDDMAHIVDEMGRKRMKRNGYSPERQILTGIGPIDVRQPRVRGYGERRFTSKILPPYMRKVPSINNLIPVLYLKGISTGDFPEALSSILGENAQGLSPKSIERLKMKWADEYKEWNQRDLSSKKYVYVWADGIHFNIRLADPEDNRMCFLVLMGSTEEGTKELIAVQAGYRESKSSWQELIGNLKQRGLGFQPKLASGDGALGFWAAIEEVWPQTKHQRCWVHKTANILDKMPKSVQGRAKEKIHAIYMAETRDEAYKAWKEFLSRFEDKYPKACDCLRKDKDELLAFYDFPAKHWQHIRSTNPIESTFATVRHRTKRTKGCGSRMATETMVFKLCREAEKRWRKLQGYQRLAEVIQGVNFRDGFTEEEWLQREAA